MGINCTKGAGNDGSKTLLSEVCLNKKSVAEFIVLHLKKK